MRIGILTLPLHANYGGILQAYALQTVLERMGHEVRVFHRDYISGTNIVVWKYPLILGKRLADKLLVDKRTQLLLERIRRKENPIICQNTNRFIDTYIHTYKVAHLSDIPSDAFDCIVVGSDQVWRPGYFQKMWKAEISDAFLKFAKGWNIKRVAYAASFGVDDWLYKPSVTVECKELIKMFDGISVREDSAVNLCSEHFGLTPKHVLDPTMLLTADDYINLIEKAGIQKSPGTLYNYILDENDAKRHLVKRIAEESGMIPFWVNKNSHDKYSPIENRIIPSVEEWLRGFYDAEFVVTDSFHGCVFSIIFGKPFVAIGNVSRGISRFNSLLKQLDLDNHLIKDLNVFPSFVSCGLPCGLEKKLISLQRMCNDFLIRFLQ